MHKLPTRADDLLLWQAADPQLEAGASAAQRNDRGSAGDTLGGENRINQRKKYLLRVVPGVRMLTRTWRPSQRLWTLQARTATHCCPGRWLRVFLARRRRNGCEPRRRRYSHACGMVCGRIAPCRRGSRPYQVVLFLSADEMDATRHAWWQGGTGNSMGWT
jgi:hypothetical protein